MRFCHWRLVIVAVASACCALLFCNSVNVQHLLQHRDRNTNGVRSNSGGGTDLLVEGDAVRSQIERHDTENSIGDKVGLTTNEVASHVSQVSVVSIDSNSEAVVTNLGQKKGGVSVILTHFNDDPDNPGYFQDFSRNYDQCLFLAKAREKEKERKRECLFIDTTHLEKRMDLFKNGSAVDAVVFHSVLINDFGGQNWTSHELSPMSYLERFQRGKHTSFWYITGESNMRIPIQVDPRWTSLVNHSISLSLDAQVPMTTMHRLPGNPQESVFYLDANKRTDALAVFISSNCKPHNNRMEIVAELMTYVSTHSHGMCLNNVGASEFRGPDRPAAHQDGASKLQLMGTYRFCFTFDNTNEKGYVSEKLWQGLAAGCLPVYLGAPDVNKYLPQDGCILNVADFPTVKALGDRMMELATTDTESYDAMLRWKVPGTPEHQAAKRWAARMEALSEPSVPCRLCDYIRSQRDPTT